MSEFGQEGSLETRYSLAGNPDGREQSGQRLLYAPAHSPISTLHVQHKVESFPFNVTANPMYYGSTLSFLGTALWSVHNRLPTVFTHLSMESFD